MNRVRGNESGQALIEIALVLPVLLILLLGAFEAGRAAYTAIELESAAKAAVAYGSMNAVTGADYNGMALVAQQDAPELQLALSDTSVNNSTCACVISGTAGTASTAMCAKTAVCSGGYIVNYLNVTTQHQYTPIFSSMMGYNLLPAAMMHGNAVQEVLR